jgi:hypothetical protein
MDEDLDPDDPGVNHDYNGLVHPSRQQHGVATVERPVRAAAPEKATQGNEGGEPKVIPWCMSTSILRTALLKPLYTQAIREWPLLGTPVAVAARYQDVSTDRDEVAEHMINLYISLCGTTGFACGVPGLLAVPLTLPLNLTGVALLQLHMCAAIATLGGYDMHAASVREISIRCLVGDSSATQERSETEGTAKRMATKVAERGARLLGEQVVKRATNGVVRRLPLVGGVMSGAMDVVATQRVAEAARTAFLKAPDSTLLESAGQEPEG